MFLFLSSVVMKTFQKKRIKFISTTDEPKANHNAKKLNVLKKGINIK
jgi:hypothetical protein